MVVGGGARQDRTAQMAMVLSAQAAGTDATTSEGVAPTDLEGKAVVRRFLEHGLSYTPDSAPRNLAESLNMMTNNLRTFTLNKLRDDDTVGKIVEDHIISNLRIRSIERTKNGPWDYVVFGVKEVHKVKSGAEVTDRIVGQYNVRLTLSMKNMFGVVPGSRYGWPKNILHWKGIQESILDLYATAPVRFVIADGILAMEGNGPLNGTPRPLGKIVLADDPVAADATCACLMGFEPNRIAHLHEGSKFLGNSSPALIDQTGEILTLSAIPFQVVPEFRYLYSP